MKNEYCILVFFSLILMLCPASVQAEFVAEGVRLTTLTNDGKSTAVSWAYHGDLVAFIYRETNTVGQLKIMNSNGSNIEAITPVGNPFFAEWSWKGDKLAYEFSNDDTSESQGGVYIYDVFFKKGIEE